MYLCFIVLWSLGNVFLVAKEFVNGQQFFFVKNGMIYISDFVLLYEAGQLATSANHLSVYDPQVQLDWLNRFTHPAVFSQVFYIFQVPFMFPLLSTIGMLPIKLSYLLFTGSGLVAGIGTLVCLLRKFRKCSWRYTTAFVLAALATLPSYETIQMGQLSWLLVALLSGFFFFTWINPRSIWAGLMLALFSMKPHYALFFFAPLVATRKWMVLVWAAIWELVLLVIAALMIGWPNVLGYPSIIMKAASANEWSERMVCCRAIFSLFLDQTMSSRTGFATMAIALLFSAILSWRWLASLFGKGDGPDSEVLLQRVSWIMAINIILCLIASPHTYLHDWLLMTLSAALTIRICSLSELLAISPISNRIWTASLVLYPCISALFFVLWEFVPALNRCSLLFIILHAWLLFWAIKCGMDNARGKADR